MRRTHLQRLRSVGASFHHTTKRNFMDLATIWSNADLCETHTDFLSEEDVFHIGYVENRFCGAEEGRINLRGVEKD